jgi:hypothetical protein
MRTLLACLFAILLAAPTSAAPADPAQRDAALAVFQAWNKAIAAGKLADATPLRTAATRARIAEDTKTRAQRDRIMAMLKSMLPDTVEVLHATQTRDGQKLSLITLVTVTVPPGRAQPGAPPPGTKLQSELTLDFQREGNAWKFDTQTWGMDPAKLKPCTTQWSGMDAFEARENLSMGGVIRRVDFASDHTRIVIRLLDEEACIFLPARARLAELGFKVDRLVPWTLIEIDAWPHREDKQAAWGDGLGIAEED